jgi:hypothetical protein
LPTFPGLGQFAIALLVDGRSAAFEHVWA